MTGRAGLLAALVLAGCAGAGCGGADEPGPDAPPNLILISLDTLRADRLGLYGHTRATSPALDRFAREGAVFETAVAESSWTLPSHVTLFSGLLPGRHGVVHRELRMGPELRLLPEILRAAGYRTFALTGGGYLSPSRGFDRGFETFEGAGDPRDAKVPFGPVLERALARMRELHGREPFFAFLHTYATHCPFTPPPPYPDLFASEGARPIELAGRCSGKLREADLGPGEVLHVSDRYDAGVRWLDDELAPFLLALEREGLLRDTVVIVTSDHGEELHDHGDWGHGSTLYREVLHVPLIVRAPGVRPARIEDEVGLSDVLPTALDLLGLPVPAGLDGDSLAPLLRGEVDALARPAGRLSELDIATRAGPRRLASLLDRRQHLIVDLQQGAAELYDLERDPREQRDLAAERAELAGALRSELQARLDALERAATAPPQAGPLAEDERERLRALGYMDDEPPRR